MSLFALASNRRTGLLPRAVVSLCLIGACTKHKAPETAASQSPPPASTLSLPALPDLRPRSELPEEAREVLSARMERHGEQMTTLLVYVVMLEHDLVEMFAEKLAQEPRLGRPAPGEKGTLNAMLPAEFFVHQDALSESAAALARAARERDEVQLITSFAGVTRACVGCHTAYMEASFQPFDHEEPGEPLPCQPGEDCADEDAHSDELGATTPRTYF